MKIVFLGTRGMIKPKRPRYRNHSGVLIDNKLLFDCGEKAFLRYNPRAIFITHLHPDHAFFVEEPYTSHIPVYAPEKKAFQFITLAKRVQVAGYLITPLPTEHSAKVLSCAYLIEQGGKRVLYTGDIVWLDKKYRARLGELDCVITEASFFKEGGMIRKDQKTGKLFGHAGIPNLVRLFKPYTNTIILTHFGSWFINDIRGAKHAIAALARTQHITIRTVHDGAVVEV